MRTPSQTAASRANGARSKGPVSIQGKRNSSRNSLRHGLLARTVVLEEESTPRFLELLQAFLDEFHPATPTQLLLVETMTVARWRLLRVWGLQKVALDREIALQDPAVGPPEVRAASAFGKSAGTLQPDLLLRHEVAYDRQFGRALKQLLALQSSQAQQPAEPYHPASLPTQTWREPDGPPGESANSPQRRGDGSPGEGPVEPDPGLAVLRSSKAVHSRPFAAKHFSTERTQQPIDSTHPSLPLAPASLHQRKTLRARATIKGHSRYGLAVL